MTRERQPDLEIVCHCYHYHRLLAYQISSLFLYDFNAEVRLTVCFCKEDTGTFETLLYFILRDDRPDNLTIFPWKMQHDYLMRRAIGRNQVALATEADVVWFSDGDYLFREGCIDTLMDLDLSQDQIVFPLWVNKSISMESGDALIQAMDPVNVRDVPDDQFTRQRLSRAIGGVQIVKGSTANRYGYVPDRERFQKPCKRWRKTDEDPVYRKSLAAGRGTAVRIPGVYRIRHSNYGRKDPKTRN